MSFKSFVAGYFTALIIGIITAQFHDILGFVVGVLLGAFVAGTKKSGGAVGFLTSVPIIYSNVLLYTIYAYITGGMELISLIIIIALSVINITSVIFTVAGLILGIIVGYINLKIFQKEEGERVEVEVM